MGIAQPALSQQMHLIEARLGTPSFDRNTRPLQLTDAGGYLVAEAASLVDRFETIVSSRGSESTLFGPSVMHAAMDGPV
ncbi:LysR family transcriptional regulator [Methylobacterium sp. P31]